MLKTCPQCKTPFKAPPSGRKFCSADCWNKFQGMGTVTRTCPTCERSFAARVYRIRDGKDTYCSKDCKYPNSGHEEPCHQCGKPVKRRAYHAEKFDHVFCSRPCYHQWRSKKVSCTCARCGTAFDRKPSEIERGGGKYCSWTCYCRDREAEVVELTCEQCQGIFFLRATDISPSMYRGRFCSNECESIARRLPEAVRSEYNHEFTDALKERVRDRDDRTCQLCHTHESNLPRRLDAHHIDYDKTNNDLLNLIALCNSCHSKTNYTREYWTAYFNAPLSVPSPFSQTDNTGGTGQTLHYPATFDL